MDFEIVRLGLDEASESAADSTVVDAAAVEQLVQQAAASGERIYIRPVSAT